MRYMLLIYTDPSAYGTTTPEENEAIMNEWWTFDAHVHETGEWIAGEPLEGIDTATTVRYRDGQRQITDGPFAETKEHLGGFYLVDVKDLDRALELAATTPGVRRGFDSVEVRPILEIPAPSSQ